MPKVLLTGANGFVGSHVLNHFVALGWDLVITLRSGSDCWRIQAELNNVAVVNLDEISLERIFVTHKIDCVVHLATLYRKHDHLEELESLIESNLLFPLSLITEAQRSGVRAFINTGTFFEYAQSDEKVNENSERKPINNYAATKIAFSKQLEKYKHQMSIIELVLFSPYGPADNDKLIPYIIHNLLKHQSPNLQQGNNEIDLVHVTDIARAFELAVIHSVESRAGFDRVNIADGQSISVKEIAMLLHEIMGSSVECVLGEVDSPLVVEADITKAKDLLDWVPSVSLKQGLKSTVEYYSGLA